MIRAIIHNLPMDDIMMDTILGIDWTKEWVNGTKGGGNK